LPRWGGWDWKPPVEQGRREGKGGKKKPNAHEKWKKESKKRRERKKRRDRRRIGEGGMVRLKKGKKRWAQKKRGSQV
jgi:hypothetical protein